MAKLIEAIKERFAIPVMADISTVDEALLAKACGADLVATTLSGYTPSTAHKKNGPDLELIRKLAGKVKVPIIAEGRFRTPEQTCQAIRLGAYAVVVGTAITNPQVITGWFTQALKNCELQYG